MRLLAEDNSIIAWNFFRTVSSAGIETDQQKFYAMVLQGDVVKMKTIRNKKIVRVFINKDSLVAKAAFYKPVLNLKTEDKNYDAAIAIKADQPQLFFSIVDDKTFATQMADFYKNNPFAPCSNIATIAPVSGSHGSYEPAGHSPS